jgi:hypothetical protein
VALLVEALEEVDELVTAEELEVKLLVVGGETELLELVVAEELLELDELED